MKEISNPINSFTPQVTTQDDRKNILVTVVDRGINRLYNISSITPRGISLRTSGGVIICPQEVAL